MYPGAPKHPIFSGSTFGLLSGEKPLFTPQVKGGHEALGGALQQMGLHYEETHGKYKQPERSYIVHNPSLEQMQQLGKMFGQESVVHSQNGQHRLVYTNGPDEGTYHQAHVQNPIEHFEQPPPDFYSAIPGSGYFRINFDFNQSHPLDNHPSPTPVQATPAPAVTPAAPPAPVAKKEFSADQAAYLAKNAVAQLLRSVAPHRPHPHAYEWHDGHTEHHQEDLGGAQLPGLQKAGEHPHLDGGKPPEANYFDQNAKAGVATYKQFALPYGNVQPGQASDLLHYPYQGKLPEIEKLVHDHGYKTYYAGGKYGKPDLANKNYNTGHLMVYDPSSANADFGHEAYTKGWRQIHELAHAITYPELNKIYGEGRRIGKLGTHRTTNEALRAVHWEWLAAHKQRELSKQVGVNIPDHVFHKELNTVMHDAAHRAVTGKFTEPGGEGFTPHAHKVPLHTALQMVRDAGHQMGLKGLHDTVAKGAPMQKADPAQPLNNTVEGFMAGLKSLPKGDPRRGKHITAHMHHPAFLSALQAHPQGKQIHSMLTQHLNSTANAGLGVGAKVTMKSEAIYSSAEGDLPVADEKLYTAEEANQILLKATREKVEAFSREIKALRERELKKALVPTHNHNQAQQASAGVEDVPPGKANPKGIDKGEKKPDTRTITCKKCGVAKPRSESGQSMCNDCFDKQKAVQKSDTCDKCMKATALCKCMKKFDLVSEKGKRTDNHTVSGSKLPDDAKSKEINKDGGSGGIKLPGSSLKKSAPPPAPTKPKKPVVLFAGPDPERKAELEKAATPPMAKPPSGKNMGTAVPTSAPKPPAMAKPAAPAGPKLPTMKAELDLEKAGLPGQPKAQMAQHANIVGSKAAVPAPPPAPLPNATAHAARASEFTQAAAGAFQPKGPINSGLALAPKPGISLPGAGLKSPKAAGVTRGAVAAGPVQNAARPTAQRPGIFGKLFGKAEDVPEKHKANIARQDAKMPKPMRDVMSPPDKATRTLFEDPEPKVLHPSDKKKGPKKK